MRRALKSDGGVLSAPSVGTWRPALGLGAPVEPGTVLGHLIQAGRRVAVQAPSGVAGVVLQGIPDRRWVNGGDVLFTVGEGSLAGTVFRGETEERGDAPDHVRVVRAETDGTIYLRSEPGAPAFVTEGQEVAERATLALVEVMKTFSPVRAPGAGRVLRILVDDAASVGEGDALIWIEPA